MNEREKLIEEARGWISDLLSGNGFGSDYTAIELNAWAAGLIRTFVAEEPEWEYGYTSKWGTIRASCQADAESRAADHARGIADRRESGDLTYHGKVVKRIAAPKPGEWVPVKQEGAGHEGDS